MSESLSHLVYGTPVTLTHSHFGPSGRLVRPAGMKGIVLRESAQQAGQYVVQLADGQEIALERDAFEIAKSEDGIGVDYWKSIVFESVFGSRAYGLDTADSDTDLRGVYLAPTEQVLGLWQVPEQLEDKTEEKCYWEYGKFMRLLLKNNPNALECLFSPQINQVDAVFQPLLDKRELFLSQLLYPTLCGYAQSQFKKFEKSQAAGGHIKWKHAMHLIRLLLTGVEVLKTGNFQVQVTDRVQREKLLAIKGGDWSWSDVAAWHDQLQLEFEAALQKTVLPEQPDMNLAHALLVEARMAGLKEF